MPLIFCLITLANAEDKQRVTCENVESYVPPLHSGNPHVLKTGFSDLVFWPDVIDKLELVPWSLVCHEVCMLNDNDAWYNNRKVYTIRALHNIKVNHKKDCNKS